MLYKIGILFLGLLTLKWSIELAKYPVKFMIPIAFIMIALMMLEVPAMLAQ